MRKIRFLADGLESLNLPALSLKNFGRKPLFLNPRNEDFCVVLVLRLTLAWASNEVKG